MKYRIILFVFVFVLSAKALFAQSSVVGTWSGDLDAGLQKLNLVLHVNELDGKLVSTLDSPDQGAMGMQVNSTEFTQDTLRFSINAIRAAFIGVLEGDSIIKGMFRQSGASFPLRLSRGVPKLNRPQEPKPPFPYRVEELSFPNKEAGIELAGTLTLPANENHKYPAVVLISGSGPQDRDENIFGHKPFLVIADYLTKQGIAVLRFDDRGYGASTGDFSAATTADFATDVEAAVKYLRTRKDIKHKEIGLIGHSEGGSIAPMVAVNDKKINFVILMAAPGVSGDDLLIEQQSLIMYAAGLSTERIEANAYNNKQLYAIAKEATSTEEAEAEIRSFIHDTDLDKAADYNPTTYDQLIGQLSSPWMRYFLNYDPSVNLSKLKCAVFAINGSKDLQVSAKQNLPVIKLSLSLGGNEYFKVKEYEGLNHLFQACKTGSIGEYSMLEQTISPQVLSDMGAWINEQIAE